jgi:lipoprotein-releasing system permease protein
MRTDFFIAKRYLFAKKSHNVINIISIISVLGVMVGTAGLIIVLSVFNGFSDLVVSLYNSFDPDIKITPVTGKSFEPSMVNLSKIQKVEGVTFVSLSLEESALLKYGEKQFIATIKGVDSNFLKISNIEKSIVDGSLTLQQNNNSYAVIGGSIAYSLSLSLNDPFNVLTVYVPRKGKPTAFVNPEEAFNIRAIRPSGIFAIQQDFDSKYVLVPLAFAREIIGQNSKVTSIEIGIQQGYDAEKISNKIQLLAGNKLKAATRLQQHEFLYKILKSEKWAVYFILSFILIIAIFNIIGSLNMLIIEKKKDIIILAALGAEEKLIRNVFMIEGVMITMWGAIIGLVLGGIICFFQQQFGFIKLENSESFLIDAYPVTMQPLDFALVILIVFVIGALASRYTSSKIIINTQKIEA